MGLKSIFKNNDDFDSTLSVVFVFICFLVVLGTVLMNIIRSLPIPAELVNIFQAVKELVQLILVYHFTKSDPVGKRRAAQAEEEGK